MHPIERLRYVARSSGVDVSTLIHETSAGLGPITNDPVELVTACRRVVSRHPFVGPLWWLCSRVLCAADARREAWLAASEFDTDATFEELDYALADAAVVCTIGWPDFIGAALARRGDIRSFIVDANGEGAALVRRLCRADNDSVEVRPVGMAAAVLASTVVLIECSVMGPDGCIALVGARALAATAKSCGVPVYLVAETGCAMPELTWRYITAKLDADRPWDSDEELVPADLFDGVIGPRGVESFDVAAAHTTCPVAHELLKDVAF